MLESVKVQALRLNYEWRALLALDPKFSLLFAPYLLRDRRKKANAGKDPEEGSLKRSTELLIDGFQGSANSFVTYQFKRNQTSPIRLAHHFHSPAMIIKAAKYKVPILLTVREPKGASISFSRRWPYVSVKQILKHYVNFYSKLEPYANCFVVSTFANSTARLDHVIETVNKKFDTSFDLIDVEQANEEHRKKRASSNRDLIDQQKKIKQAEFDALQGTEIYQKAMEIYQVYEKLGELN